MVRDGERKRIAGREVVRGDLVVLSEGDRVPADGGLVECVDLEADESLLTGEFVPVRKEVSASGGGEGASQVFSGTLVVRGAELAEITATGLRSEIGKIGASLGALETEPPRLRAQTNRLVLLFGGLGGAASVAAVLLYGFLKGSWLKALLSGIALGMAMLPEEFPVVLSVFMAMGAWRISHARVLTRRAAAIELLGSATVLCTDKTGTLTQNRMSVRELRLADGALHRIDEAGSLPAPFAILAETGALASAPEPFDPMEKAFHVLARAQAPSAETRILEHAYGLRPDLLAVTQVWREEDGRALVVAKGAPEAIATLCGLDAGPRRTMLAAVDEMAKAGLRVMGLARAAIAAGEALPQTPLGFSFEFLGLAGLADPLRPGVRDAVRQCAEAGVRVVMITGDYPETARAIARQAGIEASRAISGAELAAMDDRRLAEAARTTNVFARIAPNQKLSIVQALKADGEIVAMTGDGVNDAPSLKAAHIGVAMGGRGTDVAREASSIVLLDDDFGALVAAIRLGRRIYDNLRKAVGFIMAVHVPVAGLVLAPLAFGLPMMLGPVHIAFLEMIVDPVCTLVFEAEREEDDVMNRPPRDPEELLATGGMVLWGLSQGTLVLATVGAILALGLWAGVAAEQLRALVFFSLCLSFVALIMVNRTFGRSLVDAITRPNLALTGVLAFVAAMLALTLLWPFARDLFLFGPLRLVDFAAAVAAGVFVLVTLEASKRIFLVARTARKA